MAGRENDQQPALQDTLVDTCFPELTVSAKRALEAAAYLETCGVDLSSAGIRIVTDPVDMYRTEESLYRQLHAGQAYTDQDVVLSLTGAVGEQSFYTVLASCDDNGIIPVLASRTGFSPPSDELFVPETDEPVPISASLKELYPEISYNDLRFLARVANVSPPGHDVRGGFRPLALARLLILQADSFLQEQESPNPLALLTKARLGNEKGGISSAELWQKTLHHVGYEVHSPGRLLRDPSVPRAVLIAGIRPDEAMPVFEQTRRAFAEATNKLRMQNPACSFSAVPIFKT